MGIQWDFIGFKWEFNGISVGFKWDFNGNSMGFKEISMGFQ